MTFYQLTNIQVNPMKSVLAAITKSPSPEIKFNNTTIKAIDAKASFRFLGCWYTTGKKHTPVHKIIKEEVTNALKWMRRARITDKQAIYIVNTVILTRIAYRIQNTTLAPSTCKQITNSYTNMIKHKAGLASSIPNSTMHHHKYIVLER
ncbi:851_t:CDS:1 [Ambispora leptoticha]|uniref:851_t:CDS:1 n=1 Tax=Ambispora leptoticha TaxID=144679 RepID=A0A9N9GKF2_9GLOM|nr:851_t:CDS:1 [Ambispora leptoticha]